MARNRMIKAEFFRDEKIGALSPRARLLFLSLIVHSDDGGTARADARLMRSEAFAFDEVAISEVESAFRELVAASLVIERDIRGSRFCDIANFHKHQKINKPSEFRFEDSGSTTGALPEGYGLKEKVKVKVKEKEKVNVREAVAPSGSASKSPEDAFIEARKKFRRITGKNLGALGPRAREWAGLIEREGAERVVEALCLCAKEKKTFLSTSDFPLAYFLKNCKEWLEAVEIDREAKTTTADEVDEDELSPEEFNRRERARLFPQEPGSEGKAN